MKTNLINLMQILATLKQDKDTYLYAIINSAQNTYIIELDGKRQDMEINNDFEEYISKYIDIITNIEKIQNEIDNKNNSLKVKSGLTIKEALNRINRLQNEKTLNEKLFNIKDSKKRVSETTNSYFVEKVSNYDRKDAEKRYEEITKEIQSLQNEINIANSEEFETDINLGE